MKTRFFLLSTISFFWSMTLLAATDPVSWSLNPKAGFPATKIGDQSVVVYTLTNNLPIATTIYTQEQITGGNFSVSDKCKNISLAANQSCEIAVGFIPANTGESSYQLTYGYHNNRIPLAKLIATGTGSASQPNLSGATVGLPTTINSNNPTNFSAVFTNTGDIDLTGCTVAPNISHTGVPATLNSSQGTPGCTGTIAAGESCQWDGTVTSSTSGLLNIEANMTCTGPSTLVTNPKATTHVSSDTGCDVQATVNLALPADTHTYSDNIVSFVFNNKCATPVALTPVEVKATGTSAVVTVSPTMSTCSTTLAADSSCEVFASVIPQAQGTLSVTASTQAGSSATVYASTSEQVATPPYTHTINFINQCPFNVWYGVENITGNVNVQDPTINPTPDAYKLAAVITPGVRPAVKSITIPGTYLGEFFPRTGCSINGGKFSCKTADCNSSAATGKCDGDATSPFTRIEEVFFTSIQGAGFQGTYDLSLINGISIPVEMKGLGPANSAPVFDDTPFYCTGAGAPIQPPQPAGSESLGECNWDFTVPTTNNMDPKLFNFVSYTATNYNCTNPCGSGEVCGLAYINNDTTQDITLSCGKLLGYWTINQTCSANSNFDAGLPGTDNPKTVFNCAMNYTPGRYPLGATYYDIYACNTPAGPNPVQLGSCYPSTSGDLCCGARDWNVAPYITAQDAQANPTNPDWTTTGPLVPSPLDSILWIKTGCPTGYTYPFDDHSSSFRCYTSDAAQQNIVKMDFDVVFCPGGLTGELTTNP